MWGLATVHACEYETEERGWMMAIETITENVDMLDVLNSIEETVLLAGLDYKICWMNHRATATMDTIAPLYGLPDAKAVMGKRLDWFYSASNDALENLDKINSPRRVQINIKNTYITEAALTPIYDRTNAICAYLLILFDITAHFKEEEEKDRLIEQLSVPILNVWERVYATTLTGDIRLIRSEHLLRKILKTAVDEKADYFLIDVSGVTTIEQAGVSTIHKISEGLRLVGTSCLVVGVTPTLAKGLVRTDFHGKTYLSIKTALEALLLQNKVEPS